MRCPECRQNNVPGSLFCEHCGADLASAQAADRPTQPAAAPTAPCPECGHGNPAGYLVCESCGHRLLPETTPPATPEPATAVPPEPTPPLEPTALLDPGEGQARRIETGPPVPRPAPEAEQDPMAGRNQGQLATGPRVGKVKLVTEQGMVVGKQFLLNGEEMVVGREDPSAQFFPDLDLTGLDEGYVHRRRRRLTFEGSFRS